MLKNKKKLRRQERRTAMTRTAQTLVLTGALLLGGVGSAWSAELNADADWTITDDGTGATKLAPNSGTDIATGQDLTLTSGAGGASVDSSTIKAGNGGADNAYSAGSITITGAGGSAATLTLGDNSNSVTLTGNSLTIDGSAASATFDATYGIVNLGTFTSAPSVANTTTVGAGITLTMKSAGGNTATHTGNVVLSGTNSAIVVDGGTGTDNKIAGDLSVAPGGSTINGVSGTAASDVLNITGNLSVTGDSNGGASLTIGQTKGVTVTTDGTITVTGNSGGATSLVLQNGSILTGGTSFTLDGLLGQATLDTTGSEVNLGTVTNGAAGTTTVGTGGELVMTSHANTSTLSATHTGNVALEGTGKLTLTGKFNQIAGNLIAGTGATATIDGTNGTADVLNVQGLAVIAGGNAAALTIGGTNGATVNAANGAAVTGATGQGATLTLSNNSVLTSTILILNGSVGDATLTGTSGVVNLGTVTNGAAGTTTVGTGGALTMMSGSASKATHTGAVTLDAANAVLNVMGGANSNENTITGNLSVTNGAVNLTDATAANFLNVGGTVDLAGGSITVGDGSVNGSTFTATGASTISGGVLNVTKGSTYDASSAGASITGGALNVAGTFDSTGNDFTASGGVITLNGGGTIDVTGSKVELTNAAATLTALGGTAGSENTITGDLTVTNGIVNLGSSSAAGFLKVTGTADFTANSVLNAYAAESALSAGNLTVDDAAKLNITGGAAGTYKLAETSGTITNNSGAGWTGDNLTVAGGFMKGVGVWNAQDYTLTLKYETIKPQFPLMRGPMVGLADAMLQQVGLQPDSTNAGVRFVSRALSNQYLGDTRATQATATIEGAAQSAAVGAVQGATLSAQRAGANALVARTSFANPVGDAKGGSQTLHAEGITISGVSAGSAPKSGLGLWVMPLWQSDNVYGMESGSFKTGYNSSLGGVALGADYTIDNAFRFGLAANMGGGFATSNGDFNTTNNNFNFWGLAAYGGWTQNNFGITADVGYSSTSNTVRQETPAAMQFGDLKSDVNGHVWSTGLRAEYKWETSIMDIIPHVGVRYAGLTTQGYDVKSGGTVFSVEEEFQSLWTFPVGVTFSKDVATSSGWTFRPMLDLGIIPAAGDVQAKSRVRIPGVNSSAEMKTQVADYLTFDGSTGFEVKNDNISLGLNYNIQASEHRTGHGVFGTFRYEF